jgi:hypothetical protein
MAKMSKEAFVKYTQERRMLETETQITLTYGELLEINHYFHEVNSIQLSKIAASGSHRLQWLTSDALERIEQEL